MPGLLPHAGLKRRRKAQGAAAAAAGEESAPEAGGQALVPYNPEASQKAEGDPEETGPGSEAQRSSSRGLRVQQRLFENGFLAAKMSRARKMHTLMAQLVGAFFSSAATYGCVFCLRVFYLALSLALWMGWCRTEMSHIGAMWQCPGHRRQLDARLVEPSQASTSTCDAWTRRGSSALCEGGGRPS